jgi:hypothetical protein
MKEWIVWIIKDNYRQASDREARNLLGVALAVFENPERLAG